MTTGIGAGGITNVRPIIKTVAVTQALEAASAYDANDVMCSSSTTGVQWTFSAILRANAAYGYITKAVLQSESESVTPRCTAYVFSATASTTDEDHAANTNPDDADKLTYQGHIDFNALESVGTTDSSATATPNTANSNLPLAVQGAAAADDLIIILVTRDAFTQTAGEDMTLTLTCEQY